MWISLISVKTVFSVLSQTWRGLLTGSVMGMTDKAGNVSLLHGSIDIPTLSPSWLLIAETCVLLVAMVTVASGSTSLIIRYIRCTIDSYVPSSFLNILINCLDLISLESGHKRLPEPPDNKIIFIYQFLHLQPTPLKSFPHRIVQKILVAKPDSFLKLFHADFRLACARGKKRRLIDHVCKVSAEGLLTGVDERLHIVESSDGPLYTEDEKHYTLLSREDTVSMNFWGLNSAFLKEIEDGFPAFLEKAMKENPLKGEYLLPRSINEALREGRAQVRVLSCDGKWFGVTYPEDRPTVVEAVRRMTEEGLYPSPLFA